MFSLKDNCQGGILSGWDFVRVGFCPVGFCPSGILSGGILSVHRVRGLGPQCIYGVYTEYILN